MTDIVQSAYSNRQIEAWLRGLYTVALADGNYDPQEQELIGQLTQDLSDLEAESRLVVRGGGSGGGSHWCLLSVHQDRACDEGHIRRSRERA